MGLRERNATRTRDAIVDAAMDLFFERGYEATTMEDVAAAADIGTSTLYRYFPTKDQLGTALLGDAGLMADEFAARPADEPIGVSLGQALLSFLDWTGREAAQQDGRGEQYQRLLQDNPRLAARVLEWLAEAHDRLAAAVAHREGRPADDLGAAASAWTVVVALQQVGARQQAGDKRAPTTIARALMRDLAKAEIHYPRIPD